MTSADTFDVPGRIDARRSDYHDEADIRIILLVRYICALYLIWTPL